MIALHLMLLTASALMLGFNIALNAMQVRLPGAPSSFPFTPLGRIIGYALPLASGLLSAHLLASLLR